MSTKRDKPLFTGQVSSSKGDAARPGERPPLTEEMRVKEFRRIMRSPYGQNELALVEALGRRFRYAATEHAVAFFPHTLSRAALARQLGHLYRHHWVERETASRTGLQHPPTIYSLGRLGADWLRRKHTPARWSVGTKGLAGGLDDRQPHWLGLADVWLQLHTLSVTVPPIALVQFETELDLPYGRLEVRSRFKPDAFFVLSWGPSWREHYLAYVEYDRATESIPQFYRGKVLNARHFMKSPRWPWPHDTVDYWVFVPTDERAHALAQGLRDGPFGDFSSWVFIPGFRWIVADARTQRWSIPARQQIRDPKYAPDDPTFGSHLAYPRLMAAIKNFTAQA